MTTKDEALKNAKSTLQAIVNFWNAVPYAQNSDKHETHIAAEASISEIDALLAQPEQEPVAQGWNKGYPKHPYDKEWFIAETAAGKRVCLRSLYENSDEQRGNYDFTTLDGIWVKAERVIRWMQFPDSEYLQPAPQPAQAVQPLSKEQVVDVLGAFPLQNSEWIADDFCNFAKAIQAKFCRINGIGAQKEDV